MSDFAAVSERETINAEWIMGSPRKQEVMLFADEGEGTFLSGNVYHAEADGHHPWHVCFYDSPEGMSFDEQGFDTREEAMLAAEAYFDEAGYDVDKPSRAEAVANLDYALNMGEISEQEAELMARVALRSDQGLYNVRTGLTLCPDVNGDGELFGLQIATTPLSTLMENGGAGFPADALDYAMGHYPAYGTGAVDRMGGVSEELGAVKDVHQDSLSHESCIVLDEMVNQMTEAGSGWCFSDQYSIAAKCGMVPDRYTAFSYVPDLAEPDEEPLGWSDFVEAAEGNVGYAMRLIDLSDGVYPCTMADDDERSNEVAIVNGELFMTNGFELLDEDRHVDSKELPAEEASRDGLESDAPDRAVSAAERDEASRDISGDEAR